MKIVSLFDSDYPVSAMKPYHVRHFAKMASTIKDFFSQRLPSSFCNPRFLPISSMTRTFSSPVQRLKHEAADLKCSNLEAFKRDSRERGDEPMQRSNWAIHHRAPFPFLQRFSTPMTRWESATFSVLPAFMRSHVCGNVHDCVVYIQLIA